MNNLNNSIISTYSFKTLDGSSGHSNHLSSIVTINVSGRRYETYLSTLEYFPETLLGNANKRKKYWNEERKEYFFDRHRVCFECILYYYQSNGRIRRPDAIPLETFLEELSFFQLGLIAQTEVLKSENVNKPRNVLIPKARWKKFIWHLLEPVQSTIWSRLIVATSIALTLLSCIALAIETLPKYNNHLLYDCIGKTNMSQNITSVKLCPAIFYSPFFIIQTSCIIYFTIEFLLRLISTPSYKRFFSSFFTYIDLAAIVPYFVYLILLSRAEYINFIPNHSIAVDILRTIRLLRILKIYQVMKHFKSLLVLSITLKESFIDFCGALCGLSLLAFLFGAAAFTAEVKANENVFDSIPKATYWGIITITTIGYGDMYPITATGRLIASFCALSGAAIIGMFVSVFVERYQRVFNRTLYSFNEYRSLMKCTESNNDNKTEECHSMEEISSAEQQTCKPAVEEVLIMNKGENFVHQELNVSVVRRKLNIYISMNNSIIDDHFMNRFAMEINEKFKELKHIADKDVFIDITDEYGNVFTS